MNSTWRSLLWKEWREQRWILTIYIAGCLAIGLLVAMVARERVAFISGVAMALTFGGPAMAIFVGARVAAGENPQRTLGFLQALPSSMKKAAVAKLLAASLVAVAPFLLACLVLALLYVLYPLKSTADPFQHDLLILGLASVFGAAAVVSLLIWTAALGVNHVDELRAGAIGLLVIGLVWGAIILTVNILEARYRPPVPLPVVRALEFVIAGAPGGAFGGIEAINETERNHDRWPAAAWSRLWPLGLAYFATHGALATWYVARLGRRAKPQAVVESLSVAPSAPIALKPPRRTRAGAIAWKQFRESAPLAAMGGLAILAVAPMIARWSAVAGSDFVEDWQIMAVGTWLMAGVFVAIVAGIGVFYDDLRPELHTFWLSRAINVDAWFWIKLVTGLVITVGVLAAGPLLTLAGHWLTGYGRLIGHSEGTPIFQLIGGGLLLHAATFVLAMLAIVLVRQPVAAAMLTIGVWIAVAVSISAWYHDVPRVALGELSILGLLGLAGLSVLAWQALRHDCGWRG